MICYSVNVFADNSRSLVLSRKWGTEELSLISWPLEKQGVISGHKVDSGEVVRL